MHAEPQHAPADPAWLAELNPQQRAAATAGDGPVLVVAGAGTGKTKTLAYRVAWLVHRGADPARIMLLTFTRRAAEEMLRRAGNVLRLAAQQPPGDSTRAPQTETRSQPLPRIWGGTFHSVANRLLRVYGNAIGLDADFTVLDQADAEDLMNVVRHELGLAEQDKRFPRKSTCLAVYSRCVNSFDPLEHTLNVYFPWCADWQDELRQLFKAYVVAKSRRNVLDYDDLLLFWYHMLANEQVAARIESRFDHVLVDEYQDTNRLQAGILERMRRRNRNLMVVGDDAQSIYSFRAADVHNILDFPKQFPGTNIVTLEQNYRSRQPILDATNRIIAGAARRFTKDLWSARGGDQKPFLVTCRREEEQTDFVARRILEHYEQGIPLRRQAVLFRIGHWSDHLEVELSRRKIPFHKFGGLKFLEAAHVKDLLAFLRLLENSRDQLAWFRVLNLLEGVGPGTAAKSFDFISSRNYDVRALADFPAPRSAAQPIAKLAELLGSLAPGGETRVPLAVQVERIRRYYEPILSANYENPPPRIRDLEQLEHIAAGYRSRRRFLTDLTLDPPASTADFAGPPARNDDWLTLSTIHSAKGCEWDVVFLIHATDGIIPSDLSAGDPEQLEEERRLLYVACTRAKDRLYVTWPMRYFHKHRFGDAHTYAQLTRFIPPPVREFFEPLAVTSAADEDAPDAAPSPLSAADIRKAIEDMW